MKKVLLIWLLAAGFASAGATAQNIALGERVPELKIQTWLDNRQPEPAPTTYIEFFHSTNPACKTSLERLKEITGKSGTKLRVIVVTKEDPAKIAPLLRPYLSERISVGLNAEKSFTAFGVSYLPFGVLTDAIRKMREGSYSHRAEVGGNDEISELAAEFNDMADRLQTIEDARRRFVSDASHELKTPLAGIRLLSDSILQTQDMDAQTVREFVGDIEQESERLARITENLLRLTRLDSGLLPEAQRVDLSSVVARVARMLRLVAEEKKVDLSYEVRREGQTLASEDEIHEIIYNLTENAIKYNHPGGFVKISLAGDEDNCLLTVSDDGIGIPEEDVPHLFERFYRVEKSRTSETGGTGLGLAIAKEIVDAHGGSINVASVQGKGTAVRITLPLETKLRTVE